jgi:hypothetical protein
MKTMRRIVLMLAVSVMVLVAGGVTPAAADLLTWNFMGVTTESGGTVTGSMIYNTVSQVFDDWTVAVYDPSLASIFNPAYPGCPDTFIFTPGGDQYLSTAGGQLFFALPSERPPQPPPTGTYAFTLWLLFQEQPQWAIPGQLHIVAEPGPSTYSIGVYTSLGYWWGISDPIALGTLNSSSVPLPASLLLLGSGLLRLVGWRRFRKG